MGTLTKKMFNESDRMLHPYVKAFFMCTEGSGTTVAEKISGDTLTKVTPTYNEPHAPSFAVNSNSAIAGIGKIQVPRRGALMLVSKIAASFATTVVALGDTASGPFIQVGGTNAILQLAVGTSATAGMSAAAAANELCTHIAAWDTDNLYSYEGRNVDATLVNTTALPAALKTGLDAGVLFPGKATWHVLPSPNYGAILLDFSEDGLPSDFLAGMNAMKDKWVTGLMATNDDWKLLS